MTYNQPTYHRLILLPFLGQTLTTCMRSCWGFKRTEDSKGGPSTTLVRTNKIWIMNSHFFNLPYVSDSSEL
ncbi:hypothetical protein EI94DRAFT_1740823 [Lactarius quietus]|nr:hypothetical protein EI94DRAFT_1740823 [Lactarius quietus]